MLHLAMLLMMLPQAPQAPQAPAQDKPTTSAPVYDQGPLRAEFVAMREVRLRAADPELAARLDSDLRIQVRVMGERLTEVSRYGTFILKELVDDQGKSLIDADTYTEDEKTLTRPLNFAAERMRASGLALTTRTKPASRGAEVLKRARGSIRLILAKGTENVTVVNPTQYYGKTIENPRLAELGIEIEVVSTDDLENAPPANRCVVIRHKTKPLHVHGVKFLDGWMRPVSARENLVETKAGDKCQLFYFDSGILSDEMQMVLELHEEVEDIEVPIVLDGLELP